MNRNFFPNFEAVACKNASAPSGAKEVSPHRQVWVDGRKTGEPQRGGTVHSGCFLPFAPQRGRGPAQIVRDSRAKPGGPTLCQFDIKFIYEINNVRYWMYIRVLSLCHTTEFLRQLVLRFWFGLRCSEFDQAKRIRSRLSENAAPLCVSRQRTSKGDAMFLVLRLAQQL